MRACVYTAAKRRTYISGCSATRRPGVHAHARGSARLLECVVFAREYVRVHNETSRGVNLFK